MPELPEVQTIVNDLNKKIIGEQIVDFWSDWKKNVRPSFSKFRKEIRQGKALTVSVIKIRRIEKQIIIDLNNKNSILIHLKMSGHLLCKKHKTQSTKITKQNTKHKTQIDCFGEKVNQYIHHIFYFESGNTLEFSDLRKFGWLSIVETNEVENQRETSQLGVDAISSNFTLRKFKEILNRKQKSVIGTSLLDQNLIAGIGNIYRSEILFSAGVLPQRKISSLNGKEVEKIFKAIKSILKRAIKMRGTSDSDYRDTEGKKGGFQKVLNVYRREGEKCRKCRGKIKREKLGQRSIFFCPKCQK